ncbi:MAG: hypothetical protein ACI8PB_003678 [Desulforhopalus sp.]
MRNQDNTGKPAEVVTDNTKVNEGDALNVLLDKGDVDCVVTGKRS